MAFIAVFLVVFVVLFFKNNLKNTDASLFQSASGLEAPDEDWDNDGLTNKEEAYWGTDPYTADSDGDGYKDGEEVASGHDPLVPGPDDLIYSGNITKEVSDLTLAGFYAGSLTMDSPDFDQSLNSIADAAVETARDELLGTIDKTRIKTTGISKSSQEKYLEETVMLLSDLLKALGQGNDLAYLTGGIGSVNDYYTPKIQKLTELTDRAYAIQIPNNWTAEHFTLIKTIDGLNSTLQSFGKPDTDPIKAMVAGQMVSEHINVLAEVVEKVVEKAATNKLNLEILKKLR